LLEVLQTLAISNFSALIALKDPDDLPTPKTRHSQSPPLSADCGSLQPCAPRGSGDIFPKKKTFQGVKNISLGINRFTIPKNHMAVKLFALMIKQNPAKHLKNII